LDLSLNQFRQILNHELTHTFKQSFWKLIQTNLSASLGNNDERKIIECEADLGSNYIAPTLKQIISPDTIYNNDTTEYPSDRNRLKSALVKEAIENYTGISIESSLLDVKPDCSFTINTNTDYGKSLSENIPAELIQKTSTTVEKVLLEIDDKISNSPYWTIQNLSNLFSHYKYDATQTNLISPSLQTPTANNVIIKTGKY